MRDTQKSKAARWAALLFLGLAVAGCASAQSEQIDREEAIEIARQHVSFEPESVEAQAIEEDGQPIWRVTFRKSTGPHPMGGIMIVDVDRETGRVVGLAKS